MDLADRIIWAMNVVRNNPEIESNQCVALSRYVANGGGYINIYADPIRDASDHAREARRYAPDGWTVFAYHWGREAAPAGSVRIGQVKIRSGDPESPIYLVQVGSER